MKTSGQKSFPLFQLTVLFRTGVLFFLMAVGLVEVNAQDTEQKDRKEVITIYIRLEYMDSSRFSEPDDLLRKLEEIKGANDIRINPFKQLVSFNMNSVNVISEEKLGKKIREAGFVPLKMLFSPEPLEEIDGDVFF